MLPKIIRSQSSRTTIPQNLTMMVKTHLQNVNVIIKISKRKSKMNKNGKKAIETVYRKQIIFVAKPKNNL